MIWMKNLLNRKMKTSAIMIDRWKKFGDMMINLQKALKYQTHTDNPKERSVSGVRSVLEP